ncbi:MAG: hypothetical protein KZQ65_00620 [Candidatus Thiodiazotropha sp. (ex Gloverina cf. vestifex)]|nr:hypothetical protein [Candidatus Thiodiazotropha sp. (ex Gloverina cf. vestifex)]
MAQVDMKRLHMGCGESLQAHLPSPFYNKRYLLSQLQRQLSRLGGGTVSSKKMVREESR